MRKLLAPDDFNHIFDLFDNHAFRFEARESYFVEAERESFEAFLKGHPIPIRNAMYEDWLNSVRRLKSRGKQIERLRVLNEPPTDYQLWSAWQGEFNEEAGEVIRYMSRSQAALIDLPVAGGDWWLLDSERVAIMEFDEFNRPRGGYVDTTPDRVRLYREWRDKATGYGYSYDVYEKQLRFGETG